MKILIVDDSRAMRRIIQRTLRQAGFKGYEIVEAENGAEALDLVRSESPDLILSDWHMPVMSGLEFKRALNEADLDIPFGFITSENTLEMRAVAAEAGADFLLAKPFTPNDMAQALGLFVT
ncbi:response regulator [bacterium]|nr:response regulator [bacterium]MBU1072627.1 response regulator [bacterium]MBU1675541.1 response regulator [bacterium]